MDFLIKLWKIINMWMKKYVDFVFAESNIHSFWVILSTVQHN